MWRPCSGRPSGARWRWPGVLTLLCAAIALTACGARTQAPDPPASFTTGAPGRVIPSGFVGLSTEMWAIPQLAGEDPDAPNLAFEQLVRNLAPGQRPVIRLGGDSTDWTWWPVPGIRKPPGHPVHADAAVDADHQGVRARDQRAAAARDQPRGQQPPARRASRRRQLVAGLGAASIDALEIGNEPELYGSFGWYRTAERSRGRRPPAQLRRAGLRQRLLDLLAHDAARSACRPEQRLADVLRRSSAVSCAASGGSSIATVHAYPLKHCVDDQPRDDRRAAREQLVRRSRGQRRTAGGDRARGTTCRCGSTRSTRSRAAVSAASATPTPPRCGRWTRCLRSPAPASTASTSTRRRGRSTRCSRSPRDKRRLGGVRAPRLLRDADVRPGDAARLASGADQRARRRRGCRAGPRWVATAAHAWS